MPVLRCAGVCVTSQRLSWVRELSKGEGGGSERGPGRGRSRRGAGGTRRRRRPPAAAVAWPALRQEPRRVTDSATDTHSTTPPTRYGRHHPQATPKRSLAVTATAVNHVAISCPARTLLRLPVPCPTAPLRWLTARDLNVSSQRDLILRPEMHRQEHVLQEIDLVRVLLDLGIADLTEPFAPLPL